MMQQVPGFSSSIKAIATQNQSLATKNHEIPIVGYSIHYVVVQGWQPNLSLM